MEPIEFEGKTVDEAIEKAVEALNAPREHLNVEVVSNGAQSFFNFLGAKKARIKVSVARDGSEEKKDRAQKLLGEILGLCKISTTVSATLKDNKIFLTIEGDGTGLLIGKRGQTLDAIQYLVNKMVNRDPESRIPVIVDTENYRTRREVKLATIAQRLGDRAKRQQVSVATGPLNPQERRVIYLALQNNPDLVAKSEGEGELKRVVIIPRKRN